MKILIDYVRDQRFPFCARTYVDNEAIFGFGETKEQAKQRLISKVQNFNSLSPLPEPEEIEL